MNTDQRQPALGRMKMTYRNYNLMTAGELENEIALLSAQIVEADHSTAIQLSTRKYDAKKALKNLYR